MNSKIVIICLIIVTIDAKPVIKDNSKRTVNKNVIENVQFKAIGHNWMSPYQRINISAKLNNRNEERRRHEATRPTKSTTTTTTKPSTINPLCMPHIVKVEIPSQPFYPPFTSKDWSPGSGR
ncbi:hypothetical protein PVAND_005747 [Polypedilum vanderplanki]|uniref:Secreted protein n=1 Tax=Polypedilum vanderplanki TaxID=319348 RepID=A0A9J6C106_POLVA|nr:hypothetical protein PVAND_005747 [Polypedilum vanderplanki]